MICTKNFFVLLGFLVPMLQSFFFVGVRSKLDIETFTIQKTQSEFAHDQKQVQANWKPKTNRRGQHHHHQ